STRDCGALAPDLADAVFGIPPNPEQPEARPRLGVALAPATRGVRIAEVTPGSVAAAAGLRRGDVIVQAAGTAVTSPQDLRALVDAQPPGAWLPLVVRRGGKARQVIARFERPR